MNDFKYTLDVESTELRDGLAIANREIKNFSQDKRMLDDIIC